MSSSSKSTFSATLLTVLLFFTCSSNSTESENESRGYISSHDHRQTDLKYTDAYTNGSKIWPDPASPPIWPNTFKIEFSEVQVAFDKPQTNMGSWYYDYDHFTARFDHYDGQKNKFCQGQGLEPDDSTGRCQLLFTKTGDLWVIYPEVEHCCRLCGTKQGCSVLRPDWLKTGGQIIGVETISNRRCAGWAKHGFIAPADTYYADENGVPCRYHEVVVGILHNITFVTSSFSTDPIDQSVFAVPQYCTKKCRRPFPP